MFPSRAYDHAYNLLAKTFLPLFHKSDDVSIKPERETKNIWATQCFIANVYGSNNVLTVKNVASLGFFCGILYARCDASFCF